jgi:sugar O-acyltransferase (sialic acid O-acetyltransferase NeuD family)
VKRDLIILGTSGLAREMALVAEHVNARSHAWTIRGFVAEHVSETGKDLGVAPVLGDDEWLLDSGREADLVIGIGYPKVKAKVLARYLEHGDRFGFPNLVHPGATLDFRRIEFGRGNVVTAGCAFTCDITVADFNLFNLNTTVGHDVRIGSFNVFNPSVNVSGGVHVGDRVLVGTGCQILEQRRIGSDAVLGAGAVVRSDVADSVTVVGVPAKPLQRGI